MKIIRFTGQLALLTALYYGAVWLTAQFDIPVPASVVGMAVLFLLLVTGVVPERLLAEASNWLTAHLGFFFIPIAVGLMAYGPLIQEKGLPILATIIGSTVFGLWVTSGLSTWLSKRKEAEK